MKFKDLIAKYYVGLLQTEDLPEVALKGIEEGFESNSLYILAGFNKNDNYFEIKEYFEKSLKELNIEIPDEKTAIFQYSLFIVNEILSGKIEIMLGIFEISEKVLKDYFYDFFEDKSSQLYEGYNLYLKINIYEIENHEGNMIKKLKLELFEELKNWKNFLEKELQK